MHRFRILLLPFSVIYNLILRCRHFFYDRGLISSNSFEIPTIVVGNLALGGTGKSPVTIYVAEILAKNHQVAILSRGYGRTSKGFRLVTAHDSASDCGDEPLQFKKRNMKNVVVAVCEDRSEGVRQLLSLSPKPEVIILDDAMQHRALKASCYILLSQLNRPFFSDYLIPAGNLRDIKDRAKVADVLLWTKSPEKASNNTVSLARKYAKKAIQFSSMMTYQSAVSLFENAPEDFKSVVAVAGIADPSAFFNHLSSIWKIEKKFEFPDHHVFTDAELKNITDAAQRFSCPILTTEKDAMRLLGSETFKAKRIPVLYIPIAIKLHEGEDEFESFIRQQVKP